MSVLLFCNRIYTDISDTDEIILSIFFSNYDALWNSCKCGYDATTTFASSHTKAEALEILTVVHRADTCETNANCGVDWQTSGCKNKYHAVYTRTFAMLGTNGVL